MKSIYRIIGLLVGVLLIGTSTILSQPDTSWTQFDNNLYDLEQTVSGDYVVAGSTEEEEAYWGHTSSDGVINWVKRYEFDGNSNIAYDIEQTEDEGFILTGKAYYGGGFGNNLIFLIKTESDGDTLWTRTYSAEDTQIGRSVIQTSDGGYLIAGEKEFENSYGEDLTNAYLVKADENGDTLWTREFGSRAGDTEENDVFYEVTQAQEEGYIAIGMSESFGGNNEDGYAVHFDTQGDTLWTRNFEAIELKDIVPVIDGGYLLAGTRSVELENEDSDFTTSREHGLAIKVDNNGDTLWSQTFRVRDEDYFNSVVQTSDKGFLLSGNSYQFDGTEDNLWTMKISENGDSLWSHLSEINGIVHAVKVAEDGGFLLAGEIGIEETGLIKYPQGTSTSLPTTGKPRSIALKQNYPNPFNPSTDIQYTLDKSSEVTLTIYNTMGQKVATLVDGTKPAGTYSVQWNGKNGAGAPVSSGVYIYQLRTNEATITRKMTLIK